MQSAQAIINTADGGFALVGWSQPFFSGTTDPNILLIKTNEDGKEEWIKTYGHRFYDRAETLIQTMDEGYALAGSTVINNSESPDTWLVKTTADGSIQWNQTYARIGLDETLGLVQTIDGGYALAGSTKANDTDDWDWYLIKTDIDGTMQWNRTYERGGDNCLNDLIQTSDGGFALTGSQENRVFSEGDDMWVVKTDPFGLIQWNQTFGQPGNEDVAISLVQTSDGGYAMAGSTGWAYLDWDIWLVKIKADGILEWDQIYDGPAFDLTSDLIQTRDGGFAITGSP
jgi:hypothetical protein